MSVFTSTLRVRARLPGAQGDAGTARQHRWMLTAAAAAGATALLARPTYRSAKQLRRRLLRRSSKPHARWLNPMAADALCGAIGEIAQLVVTYPIDTVKVLCQAQGASVGSVVSCIRAKNLGPWRLFGTMYAGCGAAAACSVLIGAAYLVSFYQLQRLMTRAVASRQHHRHQRAVGSSSTSTRDVDDISSGASARVDAAAACATSMLTSLLEGPAEMFRHRMQAGLAQGRMLHNMAAAARMGGLGCLYHGYLAFLAKSLPYDVAELFTYSQLSARDGGGLLQTLPAGCRDMLIGACAGTAAVLASMPADCVKTQIELSAVRAPGGLLPDLALFFATARSMLRHGGFGALFRGMGPRLADKVPSTMVYWVAVEGCRRALEPYTQLSEEERLAQSSSRGSMSQSALQAA